MKTTGNWNKTILILMLTSVYVVGFSQHDQKIDSLLTECRRLSPIPDSLKIVGSQLLEFGRENQSDRAIFEGYFAIGLSQYRKGKIKEAFHLYDSALSFANLNEHYSAYTRILRNRGITLTRLGEYNQAEKDINQLLEISKTFKKPREKAYAFNQLGIVKKYQAKWPEAIDYFGKALNMADSLNNESMRFNVLTNIGLANSALKQPALALRYRRMALQSALATNRINYVSQGYNNLGVEFREQGRYDSAMLLFRKNLIFQRESGLVDQEIPTLQNIGDTYLMLKQYDSSKYYLRLSLKKVDETNNGLRAVESTKLLGKVFFEQDQYDSAITYYDSALNLTIKHKIYRQYEDIYDNLAIVYEAKGDFKTANKFLHYQRAIKDSIYSIESVKSLNEILTKYEVSEKDEEIIKLSTYKRLIKPIGAGLVVFVIVSLAVYIRWKRSRSQLTESEKENLKFKSEIEKNKLEILELKSRAIIPVDEIIAIKADGHYLEFRLVNKVNPEIDRDQINSILRRLPSKFIQTHRSYVVNIDHIKIKYSDRVVLNDGIELPVSRTYKKRLAEALNQKE